MLSVIVNFHSTDISISPPAFVEDSMVRVPSLPIVTFSSSLA